MHVSQRFGKHSEGSGGVARLFPDWDDYPRGGRRLVFGGRCRLLEEKAVGANCIRPTTKGLV